MAAVVIDDRPGTIEWQVVQGNTWTKQWTFTQGGSAMNLTGYTWLAQLRTENTASGTLTATFTTGGTPASGIVTVTLAAATTEGITPGTYWFALRGTDGSSNVRTYIAGQVFVTAMIADT